MPSVNPWKLAEGMNDWLHEQVTTGQVYTTAAILLWEPVRMFSTQSKREAS